MTFTVQCEGQALVGSNAAGRFSGWDVRWREMRERAVVDANAVRSALDHVVEETRSGSAACRTALSMSALKISVQSCNGKGIGISL